MTQIGTLHTDARIKRLKLWRAALLLLPVALVLGVVALYIAGNAYFSTGRALQGNWGISVPDGLREIEHAEEESFHGDGYRFTVFEVEDSSQLAGTFFDVGHMSTAELTSDQMGLVAAITGVHRPTNYLVVPQAGLLKAERIRYDNELLSIYDAATNRFYVYESFI